MVLKADQTIKSVRGCFKHEPLVVKEVSVNVSVSLKNISSHNAFLLKRRVQH